MCFFDSPIARCEVIHELVLTDETQAECAGEHHCPPGTHCPLEGYFAETSGMAETTLAPLAGQATTHEPALVEPALLPAANSPASQEPKHFNTFSQANAEGERQVAACC